MKRLHVRMCAAIAILSMGLPSLSSAQDTVMLPVPTGSQAAPLLGITVVGHADLKLDPDVAYASFSVTNSSRKEIDAGQKNAEKMQAVMTAIEGAGIAATDIHTEFYMVSPDYNDDSDTTRVTGYTATNSLHVTIHDLSKVGLIIDAALQAGAVSAGDIEFDLTNRDKSEQDALGNAVSNARSKAELVAGASDVTLGRLLNLTESQTSPPPPMPGPIFAGAMAMGPRAAPTTPISPQIIEITADVTATFAIDSGKL
jgi:uncharacterized protein